MSAVVVAYSDPPAALRAVASLLEQTLPPVQIVVVDNEPRGRTAAALRGDPLDPVVEVMEPGRNIGYTQAVNRAAATARGEWIFCLNPDAVAAPDCLELLVEAGSDADVAGVGAQILLPDGRVNAGDNPINLAGISWSGGYGTPRDDGPSRDTAGVSGAALLARRSAFLELGGLCPDFFLYQDDADWCWRARLAGLRVRYCPRATVTHDYEFERGEGKWFFLERNRHWALLSNLSPGTIALLTPLLIATELAVLVRAATEGWLGAKLRAWGSVARHARRIARWRRTVQALRRVSDAEVLARFHGGMATELLDSRLLDWTGPLMDVYRRAVLAVLRRQGA